MEPKEFRHFIDGAFVGSRKTFEKRRPSDNALVGYIHEGGREEVDAAVKAARAAMRGPWGRMTIEQRVDLLYKVADGITRRFDDFVAAEMADTGQPKTMMEHAFIPRGAANFKIFAFCLAAVFSAIGGALFTLEVGFMSPSFVGIVPSIEMVIYTAVGGRMSIFGAVYGTLLVNFAKTSLSESFPELWLLGLGGLFIAVVLIFPNGLAGIWKDYVQPVIDRLLAGRGLKTGWSSGSIADGAPAE